MASTLRGRWYFDEFGLESYYFEFEDTYGKFNSTYFPSSGAGRFTGTYIYDPIKENINLMVNNFGGIILNVEISGDSLTLTPPGTSHYIRFRR